MNSLQTHGTKPWLWLVLAMLPILGLHGCTHVTHKREADIPDIIGSQLATDQQDDSAWLESEAEDDKTPPRDLWERLRRGFRLPKPASSAVATQATHIAERGLPERVFARASPLLHLMMKEIQRRQLPMELVLLPFVESSFLPQAHSPVGADGPWQFMPATAREQGLAINRVHDDRRAWIKSTRAALDYLQKLHTRFDDWPIAMAAYNAGEGRVEQALRRHGTQSRFEELSSLPLETRDYVTKIFAWRALLSAPERFGVELPQTPNAPQLEEVPITQDLDIALAARLAGLPEARFRQLNPAFSGPMIAGATRPSLLLPGEAAHRFKRGLAERHAQHQPLAKWSFKHLSRAATAVELARQWRLDAATLLAANPLDSGRRYQAGSMLFIPRRFAEEQPNAADIRYATLSTEPIPHPHPIKTKKSTRRNGKLQTKAISVNYRPSQALKAQYTVQKHKNTPHHEQLASSHPLMPDGHCSSRFERKTCKPAGRVITAGKGNKVAALTQH
jgi:membrane-bound lytic murein transglycosylase D